jgi:hypothetical protein
VGPRSSGMAPTPSTEDIETDPSQMLSFTIVFSVLVTPNHPIPTPCSPPATAVVAMLSTRWPHHPPWHDIRSLSQSFLCPTPPNAAPIAPTREAVRAQANTGQV